jgi:hypothetical protein
MQQEVMFMWQKDESHEAAVKIMHISVVSYIKYKEMWVSGLSQVRNICSYTPTNLNSLIWVLANVGNIGNNMYIVH